MTRGHATRAFDMYICTLELVSEVHVHTYVTMCTCFKFLIMMACAHSFEDYLAHSQAVPGAMIMSSPPQVAADGPITNCTLVSPSEGS